MTGPGNSVRGSATYRPPVTAGQSYPPLGFTPQGQPQYQYLPPRPEASFDVAPETPPPGSLPPEPPRKPTGPGNRNVWAVVGLLVLVAVVVGAVKWFGGDDSETDFSRRADPPASQNIDDPYLDGNEDPNSPRTSTPPSATEQAPGPESTSPSVPGQYSGQQVTYFVSADGPATVLYIDPASVQLGRLDGGTWTKSFEATENPLRITVIANSGQATCKISVAGKVVAQNSLSADAPSRTLTCAG